MQKTHRPLAAGVLALAASGTPLCATAAGVDPYDGAWHVHLIPYLWLPAVSGSADLEIVGLRGSNGADLGALSLSARTDPDDYLSDLRMAFMLIGEVRKGPWSVYTDIMYTSFSGEDTKVRNLRGPHGHLSTEISADAGVDLSATVWTLGGGYTLAHNPSFTLDLIAGFRYLAMGSDLTLKLRDSSGRFFRTYDASMDQETWDGIVGVRGQIALADSRWFLPFYLDVGTGDSNLTWQALAGLGYRFDWGEATLAIRTLGYEFDKYDGEMQMTGPGLGVGFRW